jgi:hypothetical protein
VNDLKADNDSWISAFENTTFDSQHLDIMLNIHVENECKGARDMHSAEYSKWRCVRYQNDGIEQRFLSDIVLENDEENDEDDNNANNINE